MKKKIADLWVKALRSGEFKQGKGRLERRGDTKEYCCLGVLCELALLEGVMDYHPLYGYGELDVIGAYNNYTLPLTVQNWAGIQTGNPEINSIGRLSHLNDVKGKSFSEIANIIEKHYKEL